MKRPTFEGQRKRDTKTLQKVTTVKMTPREKLSSIKQTDSQMEAVCDNMDLPFMKQSTTEDHLKIEKQVPFKEALRTAQKNKYMPSSNEQAFKDLLASSGVMPPPTQFQQ